MYVFKNLTADIIELKKNASIASDISHELMNYRLIL